MDVCTSRSVSGRPRLFGTHTIVVEKAEARASALEHHGEARFVKVHPCTYRRERIVLQRGQGILNPGDAGIPDVIAGQRQHVKAHVAEDGQPVGCAAPSHCLCVPLGVGHL
jgi:hypothetical protein